MTIHNLEEQLRVVWGAINRLDDYIEDDLELTFDDTDDEADKHDDICLAMAAIREALGLPDLHKETT